MKTLSNILFEKKSLGKYEVYHRSYVSAIDEVVNQLAKKGYKISDDDMWDSISTGPKKPSDGKTNRFNLPLQDLKTGEPTKPRRGVAIQIYGRGGNGLAGSNPFELNMYIT